MTVSEAAKGFYEKYKEDYKLNWALPAKCIDTGLWVVYFDKEGDVPIHHMSYGGYAVVDVKDLGFTVKQEEDSTFLDIRLSQDECGFLTSLLSYTVPYPEYSKEWSSLMDVFRIDSSLVSKVFEKYGDTVLSEIRPLDKGKFVQFYKDMGQAIVKELKEEVGTPHTPNIGV